MTKVNFFLGILNLGVLATVLVMRNWRSVSVEQAVESKLREREGAFVREFTPDFRLMFADMEDFSEESWAPTTLEKLVQPLVRVTSEMVGP